MTEYTAKEVFAEANRHGDHVADMLTAYAERIEADARPVTQSEVVAGARIRHIDGAVVYDLALTPAGELLPDGLHQFYTTPPAQPTERVPEGWVLVPREPTEAILEAFFDGEMSLGHDGYVLPSSCWQAMLVAATSPGESE